MPLLVGTNKIVFMIVPICCFIQAKNPDGTSGREGL